MRRFWCVEGFAAWAMPMMAEFKCAFMDGYDAMLVVGQSGIRTTG